MWKSFYRNIKQFEDLVWAFEDIESNGYEPRHYTFHYINRAGNIGGVTVIARRIG
jgi:hypothetical protein